LSIDESSPLKQRKSRNNFEHYDFYIQDWHERSKDRVPIDSNLAAVNYPAGKAPGSVAYMRNFDPERFVLTFRNRDYEINEVVKATTQLLKNIKAMD
jgi:hypothetical protein